LKKVKSLEHLHYLACNKKCVVTPSVYPYMHHMPAAFVLNYSGGYLMCLFRKGMFEYKRKIK